MLPFGSGTIFRKSVKARPKRLGEGIISCRRYHAELAGGRSWVSGCVLACPVTCVGGVSVVGRGGA